MSQKTVSAFALAALLVVWMSLVGDGYVSFGASPSATPGSAALADPVLGDVDLDEITQIDLRGYPLIPELSPGAKQIYQEALAHGSDPRVFIKVGDCMTANPYFLVPMGEGDYALGDYAELQIVIDHFMRNELNPFSRVSQAAAGGFNAASVLDSLWANPEFCEPGETPLACEMRLVRPSIALIMFGTNDVFYLNEMQFDFFLRAIVVETIRQRALPVLSTFPQRPEFPEKSVLYNQIVIKVALDYDIPLINLWAAVEHLPNSGVDSDDTTHMSVPASGEVCHFVGENMQAGFTLRNLLTLQTLANVIESDLLE